MHDRGTERIDL